jgi:membrane fusion protein (multidrug efflux system)
MRRAATVAAVVTSAVFATACGQRSQPVSGPAAAAPSPPPIEVTRVVSRMLESTVSLPGELKPYEAVDVFAPENGFVTSIRVDRGSRVKAGDILAELDAPELRAARAQATAAYQAAQAQFAAAQAKLAGDRATYEHMRDAAKVPGVVAGNDVEVAQRVVEAGEANMSALQKSADAAQEAVRAVSQRESYLTVRAPFDGEITTRYVHPGALVGPAGGAGTMTPLFRVQSVNRTRVVVPVPENDVAGIPRDAIVTFTTSAFPGRTFQAPIARISGAVDEKTRTMPVELDASDPKGELAPGSFCDVQWPVRRSYPTLFVPATSVATNLQRSFVIRVRGDKTEWVDVRTGVRTGNSIEVFGDLREGDLVAVRGSDQIRAGTAVQTKEVKATP